MAAITTDGSAAMPIVEREWQWHFGASPEALWPLVADTAKIGEISGLPRYTVTDTPRPDGTVERIGNARRFGITIRWEEGVPEWVAGRSYRHERRFRSRLVRRLVTRLLLDAEPGGARLRYRTTFDVCWPLALALRGGGLRRVGRTLDAFFRDAARFAESELPAEFTAPPGAVSASVRSRVAAQAEALAARGHAAAHRLAEHLVAAPDAELERMRPRALARRWEVAPRAAIETCLAAVHDGLLTLRWDLVCPQCRGAKLTATSLDQLPQGAHCPSCNIDYERDFTQNVEVTFEPAAAVRELGAGSYCLASPLLSEHIKVQRRIAPGEQAAIEANLPDGSYRARTVEPGDGVALTVAAGRVSQIALGDGPPTLGAAGEPGVIGVRNTAQTAKTLVIEDRRWAQDALTAHEATTMQAFRDLFADAVLRPGDQVAIGRIAFLFTDIKGSTDLYNRVGDARAYGFVREHFAVLTRAVREHDGAVVKTIGDAVMAAFTDPLNALEAALAIRSAIAEFNLRLAAETHDEKVALLVKVGLHAGACIAVTLNDRLDYFGSTVNLAARLQNESVGGDIVLSETMAGEPGVAERLAGLQAVAEVALVKGFGEPVALRRILGPE
ncbi:MAG TPA: adenylate/guanylate cyclase domain-containing protein [Stellaceae bacterium]|nr:adenylate/guanylate cyclase domain-containing protein [Stellaceae bacterium]